MPNIGLVHETPLHSNVVRGAGVIGVDDVHFVGYAFQIEMKFTAWKLGFRVAEVPITFIDRQLGASKMHKGIIKEGILGVLKLRWNSLKKDYFRKMRVAS